MGGYPIRNDSERKPDDEEEDEDDELLEYSHAEVDAHRSDQDVEVQAMGEGAQDTVDCTDEKEGEGNGDHESQSLFLGLRMPEVMVRARSDICYGGQRENE